MSGRGISTREAATILGITTARVRQFIMEGRFATSHAIFLILIDEALTTPLSPAILAR